MIDLITTRKYWTQMSPDFCQSSLPTSLSIPFTSRDLLSTNLPDNIHPTAASTPKAVKAKKNRSRNRLVLVPSASDALLEARKSSLLAANIDAREEHKLQMEILHLHKKTRGRKVKVGRDGDITLRTPDPA